MFILSFNQGKCHSTIMNADIFNDGGYKAGVMYLCTESPATKEGLEHLFNVSILSVVSPLEAVTMMGLLGAGKRLTAVEAAPVTKEEELSV